MKDTSLFSVDTFAMLGTSVPTQEGLSLPMLVVGLDFHSVKPLKVVQEFLP